MRPYMLYISYVTLVCIAIDALDFTAHHGSVDLIECILLFLNPFELVEHGVIGFVLPGLGAVTRMHLDIAIITMVFEQ